MRLGVEGSPSLHRPGNAMTATMVTPQTHALSGPPHPDTRHSHASIWGTLTEVTRPTPQCRGNLGTEVGRLCHCDPQLRSFDLRHGSGGGGGGGGRAKSYAPEGARVPSAADPWPA